MSKSTKQSERCDEADTLKGGFIGRLASGRAVIGRRSLVSGALLAGIAAWGVPADARAEDADQPLAQSQVSAGQLLTDPFLQMPEKNSVNVVWFTENECTSNQVELFEGGTNVAATRTIDATTSVPERIRDESGAKHTVYRHEAVVDNLPAFTGKPKEKIPYRVVSDGTASGVYALQAQAQPGAPLRILLTSDIQKKNMVAANMQMLYKKFGAVDAVFANGDIVDRGDAYEDWFSHECSYFRVMQGKTSHVVSKKTNIAYTGAPLLQQAPSYAAIGNHETMGVYKGDASGNTLNSEFNNPKTRAYAEALYEQKAAEVNPKGDPAVKERFIKDNSFNADTFETVLSLPENNEGNRRYYAVTVGDVRLIVLNVSRIWRGSGMKDAVTRYTDPIGAVGQTDERRGFGKHIFEPIGKGSAQYGFLETELASTAWSSAKYRVIMFHWQYHSLGGNAIPPYADPVPNTVTLKDGRQQVVYTYPMEADYLKNDVEPLIERYGCDLIFNAHSHLWNRFKTASGINILETSNNGNTYNAFLDSLNRDDSCPDSIRPGFQGDPAYKAPYEGHEGDYVSTGDPYGLSPIMPSTGFGTGSALSGEPYLMSNTVTEFSLIDTAKGTVDSYWFDTDNPGEEPVLFDSFPIKQNPSRPYGLAGSGVLSKAAGYATGYSDTDGGVAEIVSYSPKTGLAFLVNGHERKLDIVNVGKLTAEELGEGRSIELERVARVDVSGLVEDFAFGDITSVAVSDERGLVAVAVQSAGYADTGRVVLLDYKGAFKAAYECGAQPDMVCFTPDGSRVLTADEGEPREGYGTGAVDPKGSVTIVELDADRAVTVTFDAWDSRRDELVAKNVILKKGIAPSRDLEPEYIAVSPDSRRAYVTLQEANAVATLDLEQGDFIAIDSLGFKNNLIEGNELDLRKDKKIKVRWENTRGVYMPDGIACFQAAGKTYLVTANEGDASEWGDYTNIKTMQVALDETWKPVEAECLDPNKVDGLPEQKAGAKYVLGARSFSIWRVDDGGITRVFDSGSDFERITAERYPENFNASNKNNKLDSRSDAKGPEPESVTVGKIGSKAYAFVGLERIGGVMMYDVTDPERAAFVDYLNTRDFSVDFPDKGCDPKQGDIAPEGMAFVSAQDSPCGYPLVLAACEVSGTLAVYRVNDGQENPAKPANPFAGGTGDNGGGDNGGGNGGNGGGASNGGGAQGGGSSNGAGGTGGGSTNGNGGQGGSQGGGSAEGGASGAGGATGSKGSGGSGSAHTAGGLPKTGDASALTNIAAAGAALAGAGALGMAGTILYRRRSGWREADSDTMPDDEATDE